ncbi:TlpA disulfide reductase family protein [Oleiagrimonas sp.]|jgi:peroxiredoxin|uniref:TlpA family protein disulfide reductase n=1 Tax=Oleiagrimonas sp. TaxID=2010330 RepID=UPI00261FE35E|nr:TlpA disulfide reductase family protein [Oleiagrimonas sp.]MDA3914704.1 TlpA disulfide reductase family protein [Oleiagrimonas sp.]
MRAPRPSSLAWVVLALVAGLTLLGWNYWHHGVPPKVFNAMMSTRLGNRIEQYALKVTSPPAPKGIKTLGPGDRMPDWTLPAAQGKPQSFAQWNGKRVLVNFWATWCAPCLQEMPALAQAQRLYANHGVQVVGIALDDAATVQRFLKAHPPAYPMLIGSDMDPDPLLVLGDTRRAMPYSVLIDRHGRIERTHLGPLGAAQLAHWLR